MRDKIRFHQGRRILETSGDFFWYKAGLDAIDRHKHKHFGEPREYPCIIESRWDSDPNGPDEYHHEFFYRPIVICEHCGHKSLGNWPAFEDDEPQSYDPSIVLEKRMKREES